MCTITAPEVVDIEKPEAGQIKAEAYFPTVVYTIQKPEFLANVKPACLDALAAKKEVKIETHELYPVWMTGNLFEDSRVSELMSFIGETSWQILRDQGYATEGMNTTFHEFWCQEHYKHSAMEQHIHANGAQLVGFYFIDTPENCSRPVLHDPRMGKVQINLPENDPRNVMPSSNMINFEPKPGMLMFANSWLPHSFTRHGSDEPIRFIHFTIGVRYSAPPVCSHDSVVEVI
jgi:uncharacterized protein (TIGR02466 family)